MNGIRTHFAFRLPGKAIRSFPEALDLFFLPKGPPQERVRCRTHGRLQPVATIGNAR